MARTPEDLVTGIEVDAPPEVRVYVEATIRQTTDLPNRRARYEVLERLLAPVFEGTT